MLKKKTKQNQIPSKKLSRRYTFINKIIFYRNAQISWLLLLLRPSFCWEWLPFSQWPFTAPAGSDLVSANKIHTKWDGRGLFWSGSPLVLAPLLSYLRPSGICRISDNRTECSLYWKILSNWGKIYQTQHIADLSAVKWKPPPPVISMAEIKKSVCTVLWYSSDC